uniref:Water stress and hypersensitive response domain-containing protein n=1 Tax=Opuntia streptacantha TaxID=393608 RepID=A0A7C8YUR8_OPUST
MELDLRHSRWRHGGSCGGFDGSAASRPGFRAHLHRSHLFQPALDAELILTVHVNNPNIVPIKYDSATMSIFYNGSLLGTARLEAGSQSARSCRLHRLPARLSGLELAHHVNKFLSDVAKREMVLDASADVDGVAKVWWWRHRFRVQVESHVAVDPVFLDVIDQENKSQMDLFVS